ncbi:MAG: FAD binding domain-containing protein [Bryobacteraceae bacterium]|jgi:xanthine dehydrogenase YagS FAD-binding subunit
MQAFEYAAPATVQEALGLLARRWGEVDILAGGTDLLGLMKDYIHTPRRVVNIKGIQELKGIQKTPAGLRIGALVTLEELAGDPAVGAAYPSLTAAARGVSSLQIRNLGTIGGDLCQRPRCWYFRLGYGLLAKDASGRSLPPNGDNRYHAIFGNQGAACFVSASSFGPPLVALGATVKLASAAGRRELPIEKFFVIPLDDSAREIALRPNEIVTEIVIPPAAGVRNATYEVRQKTAIDWPLVTASVALKMKGNLVASARIVLGHVAPIPWRAAAAEAAVAGKALTSPLAEEAGKAATEGAAPLSGNGYKVQLVHAAVKRALLEAARVKA